MAKVFHMAVRVQLLFGMLLLIPWQCRAADEWHTFTATDGRTMVAKVLDVESTFALVELKASGKRVPLNFRSLTEADQEFLNKLRLGTGAGTATGTGDGTGDGTTTPDPAQDGVPDAAADGEPGAKHLYPRTRKEIQDGIREIAKRERSKGLSKEVHEATNQLNIYRFLCGVPCNVKGDPECSKAAEDAALACKANGGLSHQLGHSTEKCNISSVGSVVASVAQYMEDGGSNNRDVRGHRAWCLNPPMGKVGFGSGGNQYSAMWCMDSSGKSLRGTWAYPGKGLFPVEYMHGNAWSLYNAGHPGSVDKLKVEVIRLPKRPERSLPATGEIAGHSLKINHVSLGMNAINFEPEEPANRGIYWVRVNGGGIHEGYLVELY